MAKQQFQCDQLEKNFLYFGSSGGYYKEGENRTTISNTQHHSKQK